MERTPPSSDPDQVGYSLTNLFEILIACLDAIDAKSVTEVGGYRGDLTAALLEWAAGAGASVATVEPTPLPELRELAAERPELELVLETSHQALRRLPLADALVVDGDHNYYTLSEELRLVHERAPGPDFPLVMLHDVGWPHARRDNYSEPDRIPEDRRQPLARNARLAPDEPAVADEGLPFEWAAAREGGPRNGVLTATEDFVAATPGMRLVVVPAFFGFGVVWHEGAPWGSAVARIVEPWDRHPVLERLEANRVTHLVATFANRRRLAELRERDSALEQMLRRIVDSRAFALAERLSSLRRRGQPRISREQIRRLLDG